MWRATHTDAIECALDRLLQFRPCEHDDLDIAQVSGNRSFVFGSLPADSICGYSGAERHASIAEGMGAWAGAASTKDSLRTRIVERSAPGDPGHDAILTGEVRLDDLDASVLSPLCRQRCENPR